MRVFIYAQHHTMAGRIVHQSDNFNPDSCDYIEFSREMAEAWASIKPTNSNELFRYNAGCTAIVEFDEN